MNTALANIDKNSKILVTGGLGFIGSRMVKRLNELGFYDIDIIDDLNEKNQRIAVELEYRQLFSKYNGLEYVFDDHFTHGGSTKYHYIFHFGAQSSTQSNFNDCNTWNYEYTKNIISFAVNTKKTIIASSAAVYQNDFSDSEENLKNLRPKSSYAISKLLIDKELQDNGWFEKGNFISIRPFNVFGNGEYFKQNMASYIYQCFLGVYRDSQKNGRFDNLTVYTINDKFPARDFISVEDVIEKTLALVENDCSGVYNVGSGYALGWDSYAAIIQNKLAELFDKVITVKVANKNLKDLGPNYQTYTCSNNEKINAAIGSKNKTFEDIKFDIENYLDYLYENASYYLD